MSDLVFISHSNADKGVADAICAELERAGIRCWIAPRDIAPGRMWGEAILDGINSSRVMILVHSRHSNRSPQVVREIERAVDRRLLLLQVRLQDIKLKGSLEFFLASSQWLNAFPGPVDPYLASLPHLVRNLLTEAVETGEHTAERTAEHPTLPASPVAHTSSDVTPVAIANKGKPTPWRMVASVVAVLTTVGIASTWLYTQLVRDKAPTVPAISSLNSTVDSSADSVAKAPTVAEDPVELPLRITALAATYRVGERFTLRVETKRAPPLRWRSGNSKIISVSPGDSVFRAIAVGSAFVYADNETQRDSVRIKVIAAAQVVDRGTVRPPSSPVPPAVKETTVVAAGKEREVAAGKEKDVSPPLTDALAGIKARDCILAITRANTAWIRANYGSALTVGDASNLKAIESMFSKSEYRASLLQEAKFAGNTATFSMRVDYKGGFGPRLSVDVPFEVRMVSDQPQGEPQTCRVRGTLKLP